MTLVLATDRSLDDLAAEIRREHHECVLAAVSSLRHAVRAGGALLAARERVPRGTWERWLDENCPDVRAMARQYMRIATYQDMIPPETTTAVEAQKALRGLPAFDGSGPARHPESVREQAIQLAIDGVPTMQIARHLGVDRKCVRRWLGRDHQGESRNGNYRTGRPTRREQKKAQKALARSRSAAAIGPLALANRFRDVVVANRRGVNSELAMALGALIESAQGWADQLRKASEQGAP